MHCLSSITHNPSMQPTKIEVIYNPDWDCIVNTIIGIVDNEVALEAASQVAQLSKLHNCDKSLHDLRHVENKLSVMSIYKLPEQSTEAGINRTMKRAILLDTVDEDMKFYEDIAINRGLRVKIFTDLDSALKWLA